jgi:hypothetical protein
VPDGWYSNIVIRERGSSPPAIALLSPETGTLAVRILNNGSTAVRGSLLLTVERNESAWTHVSTVLDDGSFIRVIAPQEQLNLSTIWNGLGGFSTAGQPSGLYRVRARLVGDGFALEDSQAIVMDAAAEFTIDTDAPNVTVFSPENATFVSSASVVFSYVATDLHLARCELWHNASGSFIEEQENVSVTSGQNTTFTDTFVDGTYRWSILCVDDSAAATFSQERTFTVDTVAPHITLSAPINDSNLTSPIEFSWIVTDGSPNATCTLAVGPDNTTAIVSTGMLAARNMSISSAGDTSWYVLCEDLAGNVNQSVVWSFFHLIAPEHLHASLALNGSLHVNWSSVLGADSYAVYVGTNHSARPGTVNESGIVALQWLLEDNSTMPAFVWVGAVRGDVTAVRAQGVGRVRAQLEPAFNLVSLPLEPITSVLANGTHGLIFNTSADCLQSIWHDNGTGYERSDFNGTQFIPAAGSEQFTTIGVHDAYWLETNMSCNITYVGAIPLGNRTISLTQGPNQVAWHTPANTTLPINSEPVLLTYTLLNGIAVIDRFNAVSQLFEVTVHYDLAGVPWGWFPSFDNPDFTTLEPTRGYVFDTIADGNWTFDPEVTR